jgi:muramoyltetrapeptide carboxypeptidase
LTGYPREREHGAVIFPRALRPGDVVRVIAPSSPFDHALVRRGIAWLGERFRVQVDARIFGAPGLLAGDDQRRLDELDAALEDPDVAAIVAARGGYGATRIAHRAAFGALRKHPKWIVGFSDITALHAEAIAVGVASMHAHNVAGLGRGDERLRERWLTGLESPVARAEWTELETWRAGVVDGTLVGGNLTLLATCAASGRLRLPKDAILFIEDVSEVSYRVDRMLSALSASGLLDSVRGVVVGSFTDCSPGKHGKPIEQVLSERLLALRVPVLAGASVGHDLPNHPLPLGVPARLEPTRLTLFPDAN